MATDQCANCQHFERVDSVTGKGYCHYYPPQSKGQHIWHTTYAHWFCSFWKKKPVA